jgi:hypothetical protein
MRTRIHFQYELKLIHEQEDALVPPKGSLVSIPGKTAGVIMVEEVQYVYEQGLTTVTVLLQNRNLPM